MQFLDPFAAKKNKSKYDEEMGCDLKCIPEEWTSHTKIVVDKGSLTLKAFIDFLEAEYNITRAEDNMDFVATPFVLGGKPLMDVGEEKQAMKLEDIARELGCNLQENNLKITVMGYVGDDYLSMAPIKYIFA